jgi:hypothetical protein
VTAQADVNKSNNPIQIPLLLVTQPETRGSVKERREEGNKEGLEK